MDEAKYDYPTNETMRTCTDYLNELEKRAGPLLAPRPIWRHQLSTTDALRVINEVAAARSRLWEEVYRTYPALLGKRMSLRTSHIIVLSD